MKRSTFVKLVLLGPAVGLNGCHDAAHQLQQQLYHSEQDCTQEWRQTSRCTPSPSQPGYYYGPRYYWDPGIGGPVVVKPDGTTEKAADARVTSAGSIEGSTHTAGSFARGGFGSIGHGFGAGE